DSPPASPLALTLRASWGRSPFSPAWNGPERLALRSPPSSPVDLIPSWRSIVPLSMPDRVAVSSTDWGSSLLLPPPPQAARTAARAATVANSTAMRILLKVMQLLEIGNGLEAGS